MTNFALGRIGLDADINDVSVWDSAGDSVTVAFSTPMVAEGGSVLRAHAYRQMLLGYLEAVYQGFVPVLWADDPTVDGYYRVVAAQVTPDPDLALDGLFYYSATLKRVQGYGMPAVQTTHMFFGRTTIHDPTGVAYLATPDTGTRWNYAYEVMSGEYSNPPSAHYVSTEDGTVRVIQVSVVGGAGPSSGELAFWTRSIDPSEYYTGAARLEINGYPIEGRQVPDYTTGQSSLETWRLTNGLTELTMHSTANGQAILQMRGWLGSWGSPQTITIRGGSTGNPTRSPLDGPKTLTILKNTAEEVIIRLGFSRGFPVFVDVTCRRGIRSFSCRMRRASGTGNVFPAVQFTNHLDYAWRREGAWVLPGAFLKSQFMWNPRALLDTTNWALWDVGNGTATGRITGLTIGSTPITTAYRVTASGAHASDTFGTDHGVTGSTTPNNGFVAGSQYIFGVWVRCSVARSLKLRIRWRTSSGAFISSLDSSDVAVGANTWTQITVTGTAPATATRVSAAVFGNAGGSAWATGQTLDVTGLQAQLGATLDSYWDGDSGASDAVNNAYATDAAPNSRSIMFDRTGLPTYWFMTPIATDGDTDGWEPDPLVEGDPTVWDFGFGMMTSGISSGDQGRYLREVHAYNMTIAQTDDVVAV